MPSNQVPEKTPIPDVPDQSRSETSGLAPSGLAKSGLAKNGLEWTVFALSLALVAFVVGVLARGGGAAQEGPPRLHATLGAPVPAGDGRVRVPVTLTHEGGQTVEFVTAEVTDGQQTARVEFGYTPRDTERQGAVTLHLPTGPLRARVVAYSLP